MDAHTLRHEQAAIVHSIDIAQHTERYHLSGARTAHERADRLRERHEQIAVELQTATNDCDCA